MLYWGSEIMTRFFKSLKEKKIEYKFNSEREFDYKYISELKTWFNKSKMNGLVNQNMPKIYKQDTINMQRVKAITVISIILDFAVVATIKP